MISIQSITVQFQQAGAWGSVREPKPKRGLSSVETSTWTASLSPLITYYSE